jgi:hypothetical protein
MSRLPPTTKAPYVDTIWQERRSLQSAQREVKAREALLTEGSVLKSSCPQYLNVFELRTQDGLFQMPKTLGEH